MKQKQKEKEELLQKMAGEVADMIQRHESKLNENDVKLKAKEVEIEKIESKKDEEIHNLIFENNVLLVNTLHKPVSNFLTIIENGKDESDPNLKL